jgi:HlyD family secretion protein
MAAAHTSLYRVASVLTAGAVLLSGCELPIGSRGPGVAGPEPTVAPRTTTSQSRPEAKVRKGTIQDSIKVIGRIISSQEADLYFKTTNRLRGIFVETGQEVKAGQVLAEQETGTLATQIGKAKATLENAQISLDKGRAKGVVDETADDASSYDVAQINLDQALLQLEKLRSGPQDADVKGAEAGVAQALANLEKARVDLATKEAQLAAKQADLAFKLSGPSADALSAAQADVETKRVALQKAGAPARPEDVQQAEIKLEQARIKLAQAREVVVKPEDVANAELALQQARIAVDRTHLEWAATIEQRETNVRNAELALERARASLNTVMGNRNRRPEEETSAQNAVYQAETNLEAARAALAAAPAQRDAAVRLAELKVMSEDNNLSRLRTQQANPHDVRLAEQAVAAAENDLAKLRNPANQFEVQTATVAYDLAVAKLDALQRGPSEQELNQIKTEIGSLQLAVESARVAIPSSEAAMTAAQAKLESTLRGPSEFDFREQQSKVEKAQLDVEKARAQLEIERQKLGANRATTTYDVQALEKEVQKARLDLEQLEANFNDARIIAPFDGKITKVNGKSGDNVQAFNPVISISSPANLLVNAQINESDMPKLAVGQRALISLDAFPGQTLNGTVLTLPSSVVTQQGVVADKNTKIQVDWTRPGAQLGMNARVQIVVQRKDDVLLVPTQAIRTVGKRRFVEYMDGNVKRSRNVEIGITTDVDTEVVSGLDEGMSILAGT